MGKKKGGVNKLAKMSDEERARYLQHRADVEEEARRRKRELIATFIKNKLDKEEAFSRINTSKFNQVWRYILRKVKCKQMALDIRGMMDTFNYMVERKDRLLTALVKATEDSDEQHRRAFQAHTENLSYFLSIGTQRLDKLQYEYEHQKNVLLDSWDKEEYHIVDTQDKAEFKLKLITYIQDRDFRGYRKEMDIKRATEKNDARLEHEEDLRVFCEPKHLEIEELWRQLREVYSNYLQQHHPIMGHYQSLLEKDQFYQRDIAKNDWQIKQATETLLNLQKEWTKTTTSTAEKLSRMSTHKEQLAKKYWQMKRDTKSAGSRGEDQLTIMVNASQDAIKRLEDYKEKLYKIKQMAEICSKYEVGDENEGLEDNGEPAVDFEGLGNGTGFECKEFAKMQKFLLKVNRVRVQTMCLRAEKAKLAKENVQLKLYIKRYLTDLALSNKDRPMSMKIQSEVQNIDAKGKLLNRPVTCIEGALCNAVLHENRMKIQEQRNKATTVRAYPRVQCWM